MEDLLRSIVQPWYDSLSNPLESQSNLFRRLVDGYRLTGYWAEHASREISSLEVFSNFPIASYDDLKPIIARVTTQDYLRLLPEKPVAWVMTRGTTGRPKIIPVTQSHVDEILTCGARALVNYAFRKKDFGILGGGVLNLNFPSRVGTISWSVGDPYGYSSGTYARLNPSFAAAMLVPPQDHIDSLGPGVSPKDWEARFDLVYREASAEEIVTVVGVTPVMISFARYLKRRYGVHPKDLWKMKATFCTSVAKIQFKYAPILKALYGASDVVEIYSATEGVFGQQLDELPYICPNYDAFLFEAVSGGRIRMLCKMKRGEWGRLIVSSRLFPRYDMGDMVECMGGNYFRILGRARWRTILEHVLYRAMTRWFI